MSSRPAPAAGSESAKDLNHHNPRIGIALKVASALVFTGMVAMVKMVATTFPVGEVLFARGIFGLIPVLIMAGFQGELPGAFKTSRPFGHLSRAIVGATAMSLWFSALARLPLPDATAISFAAPLITVIFAALFLREKVRIYRWSAVVVGFVGILIILSPHMGGSVESDETTLGSAFAFGSAICMALAMITVRRLTGTERTSTIVIWFGMVTTGLALLTLPFGWVMPDAKGFAMLAAIGLFGGVGQILLTHSYRFADASTIAPFDYSTMIWTVIVGYLVFSEVPTIEVLVGAAIVIGAGVFVIFRERALGLDRSKERSTVTPSKV